MSKPEATESLLLQLSRRFRSGFVYQDVGATPANWNFLANSPLPVLLHMQQSSLNAALEALIQEGLSPSCKSEIYIDPGTPPIAGAAGDIALRSRALSSDHVFLLLFEEPHQLQAHSRLQGRTVMITRAKKQAAELRALLEKEGARVLEAPSIEISPRMDKVAELQSAIQQVGDYDWLVLTSVNTVTILDDLLRHSGSHWSVFEKLKIACIGNSTAEKTREYGARVELVPPLFQAESLAEELRKRDVSGRKILLPRAEGSRRILVEELQSAGAIVNEIQIYRAEIPSGGRERLQQLLENEQVDFITFTSSSTVHHFVEMAGELLARLNPQKTKIASIGPITTGTLREYGFEVPIQAAEFTIGGLVEAICQR